MDNFDEMLAYKTAKKKVREIRAFYMNLCCYCVVIPVLIYVNLTYSPEFYWFYFSAVGWGTGLVFHGLSAFNYIPWLGAGWEERKLRELMAKEREKEVSRKEREI